MSRMHVKHSTLSLCIAAALGFGLTGCGGNTENSSRIVEEAEDAAGPEVDYELRTTTDLEGSTLSMYNLAQQELIASGDFEVNEGGFGVYPLEFTSDQAQASELLLATLTVPAQSSYFDPILGSTVTVSTEQKLHAVVTSRQLNIAPSVFSELALVRALARTGYYFENQQLPSPEQLAKVIGEYGATNFSQLLDEAEDELNDILGFSDFPTSLARYEILIDQATESPTRASTDIGSWSVIVSHSKTLANRYGSVTPLLDLSKKLAADFADGDLDGRTLKGSGLSVAATVSAAPLNSGTRYDFANTQAYPFDSIYLNQQQFLADYEVELLANIDEFLEDAGISGFAFTSDLKALASTSDINQSAEQRAKNPDSFTLSTYADYKLGRVTPFIGVGDKTYDFGLFTGTSKPFIGLNKVDELKTVIPEVASVYGVHTSAASNCTLVVGLNGLITLTTSSGSYSTQLDRDLSDSIELIGEGRYYLNAFDSSVNEALNPVIQIEVDASAASPVIRSAAYGFSEAPLINAQTLSPVDDQCSF